MVTIAWVVVFNPTKPADEEMAPPQNEYTEFNQAEPPKLDESNRTYDNDDYRLVCTSTFEPCLDSINLSYTADLALINHPTVFQVHVQEGVSTNIRLQIKFAGLQGRKRVGGCSLMFTKKTRN